jgi:hypothetical protein
MHCGYIRKYFATLFFGAILRRPTRRGHSRRIALRLEVAQLNAKPGSLVVDRRRHRQSPSRGSPRARSKR